MRTYSANAAAVLALSAGGAVESVGGAAGRNDYSPRSRAKRSVAAMIAAVMLPPP
jgi:hypothetical protein